MKAFAKVYSKLIEISSKVGQSSRESGISDSENLVRTTPLHSEVQITGANGVGRRFKSGLAHFVSVCGVWSKVVGVCYHNGCHLSLTH